MFLLRLAMRPWRTAGVSQAFAGFAVGLLLLLGGFLLWMQAGLKPIVARLKQEQVITAYVEPKLTEDDVKRLVDKLGSDAIVLHQGAAVKPEIAYTAVDAFLDRIKEQYPELAREVEDLGEERGSIVPRFISITGVLDPGALDRIKAVEGIESAESSRDRYAHIVGAFRALRWVARLLIVALGLALLTGLVHVARMNSYVHRDALAILRFWGGGPLLLRIPGLLSGMSVGLLGGALAGLGWSTAGVWLAGQIRLLSPLLSSLRPFDPSLGLVLLALGAVLGAAAGLLGSGGKAAA